MSEKTYTVNEAARAIGIAVRTAREWIRVGHMDARKDPGSPWWQIPESEVKRLAGTHRYGPRKRKSKKG